jgi:colicin import membrane protein
MKTGLTISIAGHAAVLLWGLISFAAAPYEVPPTESLPVDIISDTDFSQLVAGDRTARQTPKPKPLVEKVAEAKPTEPAPKVVEKQEVVAATNDPAPPPPEPKLPEPKPVPVPPEARAEPQRQEPEKKPEPKPDPITEALKKEETKKPEPKKEEAKAPLPPKKPEVPRKVEPKFDAGKIAALLDKRDPQRHAATGTILNPTASLGATTGNAPTLTQTEIDALRAQIQQCWNPPAGAAEAKELIVTVRLLLKQDGTLSGEPILLNRSGAPYFQVAAESALRAIRRCQPYRLPIAKYDVWKDVEVTFDPRDMFRG